MQLQDLQIIVLAAGKASRMGKPKQLLLVKEKTLLEEVITTGMKLKPGNISCVIGANKTEISAVLSKYPVDRVENEAWEEGLGSSIKTGILYTETNHPKTEAILLLLADQPLIDEAHIKAMLQQLEDTPQHIIASDYGGFVGVPVLFKKTFFPVFKELLGDSGAKKLLNSAKTPVKSVPAQNKLQDIDTPADYQLYLKNHT